MKKTLKILSIAFLIFLSLGAIFGSYALISDPSGANFDWTTDILLGTPFNNFLIPGIILLIVNGLFPLYAVYLLFRNSKCISFYMILQGLILVFWLTAEIIFNPELYSELMHPMFYAIGLIIMILGILQRKFYMTA